MPAFDEKLCDARHEAVDRRLDEHTVDIKATYKAIQGVRDLFSNRLPVWATLLIGLLMMCIGILARAAF